MDAAGERDRRLDVAALGTCAALTVLWWVALVVSPEVRSWFELDAARRDALNAFLLADFIVAIGGAGLAAVAVSRRWRWAPVFVAWTAGGWAYVTLYLVGWVAFGGGGAAGIPPMLAGTAVITAVAFRQARAPG